MHACIHTLPQPPFVPSQFNSDKTIGHTFSHSRWLTSTGSTGSWIDADKQACKLMENSQKNTTTAKQKQQLRFFWHLFCVCSLEIFRSNAKKRNSRLGKSFSLILMEGLWWMWPECLWPVGNMEDKHKIAITLQGTNISPKNGILKMIFLFPWWDMLVPWRVIYFKMLNNNKNTLCNIFNHLWFM